MKARHEVKGMMFKTRHIVWGSGEARNSQDKAKTFQNAWRHLEPRLSSFNGTTLTTSTKQNFSGCRESALGSCTHTHSLSAGVIISLGNVTPFLEHKHIQLCQSYQGVTQCAVECGEKLKTIVRNYCKIKWVKKHECNDSKWMSAEITVLKPNGFKMHIRIELFDVLKFFTQHHASSVLSNHLTIANSTRCLNALHTVTMAM